MVSRSITSPVDSLTFSTAVLRIESVFSPRKSILISPVDSMTCPSYCVHRSLCPGSVLSSATDTGTQSLMGSRQMMKPQAWIPVPRTVPSSILAYIMVLRSRSSSDTSASRSSGTHLIALGRFIFRPSGKRSGICLHRWFTTSSGTFSTRATSLMEFLVAIVL